MYDASKDQVLYDLGTVVTDGVTYSFKIQKYAEGEPGLSITKEIETQKNGTIFTTKLGRLPQEVLNTFATKMIEADKWLSSQVARTASDLEKQSGKLKKSSKKGDTKKK